MFFNLIIFKIVSTILIYLFISKCNNDFCIFSINQITKLIYYITIKHDPYIMIQFFVV